jgi:hypothetical protein
MAGRSGPLAYGPAREHDTTVLRGHPKALPLLADWTCNDHAVLGDLGYEGEQAAHVIRINRSADRPLTDDQRTVNALHTATRALATRGNFLLKTPSRPAPAQPLPLANRRDYRRRPGPAPPRERRAT